MSTNATIDSINQVPSSSRVKKWAVRGVVTLAVLATLLYGAIVAFFYTSQENLIFRPSTLPASHQFNLPNTTEIKIPVKGAELSALHFKQPGSKGVIFFLHGNGGDLSSWLRSTDFYAKNNFDVFMIDYRGFGKSTGKIESEEQLHEDVMTAWKLVAPKYESKKKVIFGRSLGTTLTAKLASEVQPDWTLVVSPFYNLNALRQELYPFLPAFLMRYTFTSNEWLAKVNGSVTIVHGDHDELIPYTHSERLHKAVPKSELVIIKGGTHNNLHHLQEYVDALSERLQKL
jgi:uncharacterized protein